MCRPHGVKTSTRCFPEPPEETGGTKDYEMSFLNPSFCFFLFYIFPPFLFCPTGALPPPLLEVIGALPPVLEAAPSSHETFHRSFPFSIPTPRVLDSSGVLSSSVFTVEQWRRGRRGDAPGRPMPSPGSVSASGSEWLGPGLAVRMNPLPTRCSP